eukprot:m.30112 g.30112  ORF g.30112 m.30112 type:complete len:226 (+) comp5171_c0_seq1:134-811(+)
MPPTKIIVAGKGGRRIVNDDGSLSIFEIPEPDWLDDHAVSQCNECRRKFTLVIRRHHCRRCGAIVCGRCCESRELLRLGYNDPVRVCLACNIRSIQENDFFQIHLKTLLRGCQAGIKDDDGRLQKAMLRLTEDHRQLTLKGSKELPGPTTFEVKSIEAIEPWKLQNEVSERRGVLVKLANGTNIDLEFVSESKAWTRAIRAMMQLLHPGRTMRTRSVSSSSESAE